jgi:hypothetical protein
LTGRSGLAVGIVFGLVAGNARGATHLELAVETTPDLSVSARNTGDEPADDVAPVVVYQHRTWTGAAVALTPGARHEWRFDVPSPSEPGTAPAIVRLRYRDPHGRTGGVPFVVAMGPPDAAPATIAARLETGPVRGAGHGRLVLTNSGSRSVAGRAVFVLPDGLTTEPESMPAEIAAGGRTLLPLAVQAGNLPPDRYPVFATFEYTEDGTRHVAVAAATMEVLPGPIAGRTLRLAIGLGALAAAFLVLRFANRAARRQRAPG